mgnify:CR=1 FL=1
MATTKQTKTKAKAAKPTAKKDTATQEQASGLSLQDLILVAQIINLTSQRGAFQSDEMALVGVFYNNLVQFLHSVGAITTNNPTEEKTTEKK